MQKNKLETSVCIIGAGPGGLRAGRILRKNNVDFILVERGAPGGKINIAPRVDNYPGQHEIYGPDLAFMLYNDAMNEGVSVTGENVLSLTKEGKYFITETDYSIIRSKAVLLASGTEEKKLGLEKEEEMFGKGLSYCALCDGHFFKDQDVLVVGGGNSALKEATYLADICHKVYVCHRRTEFRGNNLNLKELLRHSNVSILTPYTPVKILGEDKLEGLVLRNRETGAEVSVTCQGFFPLIGQNPNTEYVNIDGVLDEYKSVPVDKHYQSPHCEGLFAIGDVLPRAIKQIYLAEFDAKKAVTHIVNFLRRPREK